MAIENLIIIGSGPAGYTAGIYAGRANLSPVCIEGYQSGGLLMLTSDVENFPGFPEGMMGPDLMAKFRKQAEKFGTRFISKNATRVDFSSFPLKVYIEDEEIQTLKGRQSCCRCVHLSRWPVHRHCRQAQRSQRLDLQDF